MDEKKADRTPGEVGKGERLYFLHAGYILLLGVAPTAVGFALGIRWLLPLLITIPSFFVMRRWLMRGRVWAAYAEMLLSCVWMSMAFILLSLRYPVHAEQVIIGSGDYVADMCQWIKEGGSTEGTPALFIPEHLLHMAIIMVASFATAGFLSLYFGAIQMGYMNYYVAWLITCSDADPWAYALGWPVWSIIRVFSFVLLAVALAQPMMHRFNWKRFNVRQMIWLMIFAIVLEAVDILLKTVIGPHNQAVLHRVIEEAGHLSIKLAPLAT
jgi:hypothetical protein